MHALGYKDNREAYIAAVCDADASTAQAAAEKWGVDRVDASFEAMLADPVVQAVELLTPQTLHEPMAIAAMRAGKHVSVQKPMMNGLITKSTPIGPLALRVRPGISSMPYLEGQRRFSMQRKPGTSWPSIWR